MCTLTFIPREHGYLIGMNRDERILRGPAAPPQRVESSNAIAVFPRDGAGGTWIASNDAGITLALLNWNDVCPQALPSTENRTRGELIPALIHDGSLHEVSQALAKFDCSAMLPFRLVGIFEAEKEIQEWRWDRKQLTSLPHSWKLQHWFSSGLSDERALVERGALCALAQQEGDAGSTPWLRRLHTAHGEVPGPFSVCVHRDAVETLSYTEVECGRQKMRFRYFAGSPCRTRNPPSALELKRRQRGEKSSDTQQAETTPYSQCSKQK